MGAGTLAGVAAAVLAWTAFALKVRPWQRQGRLPVSAKAGLYACLTLSAIAFQVAVFEASAADVQAHLASSTPYFGGVVWAPPLLLGAVASFTFAAGTIVSLSRWLDERIATRAGATQNPTTDSVQSSPGPGLAVATASQLQRRSESLATTDAGSAAVLLSVVVALGAALLSLPFMRTADFESLRTILGRVLVWFAVGTVVTGVAAVLVYRDRSRLLMLTMAAWAVFLAGSAALGLSAFLKRW